MRRFWPFSQLFADPRRSFAEICAARFHWGWTLNLNGSESELALKSRYVNVYVQYWYLIPHYQLVLNHQLQVGCIRGIFTGLNLHRHQSIPHHRLQLACSNDPERLGVSWRGYTRRILRTVRKTLFHPLPVFPTCPVCWTFANQFRIPDPCGHVWLRCRRP